MNTPLRLVSYLSPSLPEGLFECLVEGLQKHSPWSFELHFDTSLSGPAPGTDPFSSGEYDGAFLCAPSVGWLQGEPAESDACPIRVVAAAPVFADPRLDGKPHYYSDVVVHRDHPAREFSDLAGCHWGFNDPCSLSGYFSGLHLAQQSAAGDPTSFFGKTSLSGSHLECLEGILNRELDAAAIDSNTLLWRRQCDPRLDQLRVLTSAGPFPVQPLVVAKQHESRTSVLAQALLDSANDAELGERLSSFGVLGFAPVALEDYSDLPSACTRQHPRRAV